MERGDGGTRLFVGLDRCRGDTAVVVDGDMNVLEATATRAVSLAAGDVERPAGEAPKLLDVQVQHVAGGLMFVAWIHARRLQVADAVELKSA
jgi:hypothetical protein